MNTGFAPKLFGPGGTPELIAPGEIRRGHFVRCTLSFRGNGADLQPGIYVNLSSVERSYYGEELRGGPDGSEFSEAPTGAMPAGASATPLYTAQPLAPPVAQPAVQPAQNFLEPGSWDGDVPF